MAQSDEQQQTIRAFLNAAYGSGYDSAKPAAAARMLTDQPDLLTRDLFFACAVGDEAAVQQACNAGRSWANQPGGPLGMPPLVAVTFSGLIQLAEFADGLRSCAKRLLASGADPNQSWIEPLFPDSPLSALYGAAGKNHDTAMTRILLAAGANPNDGESLYHSLETADLACMRLLLEAGARASTNVLHHALDFDSLPALQLLLANGADPNEVSPCVGTPLQHAIYRRRSLEHIRSLLNAGADMKAKTSHGISPYRMAFRYGLPQIAALLQEDGAGDDLPESDVFVAACARGDRGAAERMLSANPDLISTLAEDQLRVLPDLAQAGASTAVQVMVDLGWPVAIRGGDWSASALNLAVFRGDAALTRFLLDHGASWTERHGYNDNVIGTLAFASRANDAACGDWLGCAHALWERGMPLPSNEYRFSHEVTEFFSSCRNAQH